MVPGLEWVAWKLCFVGLEIRKNTKILGAEKCSTEIWWSISGLPVASGCWEGGFLNYNYELTNYYLPFIKFLGINSRNQLSDAQKLRWNHSDRFKSHWVALRWKQFCRNCIRIKGSLIWERETSHGIMRYGLNWYWSNTVKTNSNLKVIWQESKNSGPQKILNPKIYMKNTHWTDLLMQFGSLKKLKLLARSLFMKIYDLELS